MKITGMYIDGFGIFHDQPLSGLDRDLVLLYGHNEAGKSTLLGFIRSVLFGFPRANSKDPAFPPATGGIHGGRIDLATGNGETWSVSRKPGKGGGTVAVTDSDDRVYDKAMLDSLLGGISYEAFRSIMAFGLSELQTIDTLSGEHITSAIYGAGLGTSMNAMPRALKQIRKRMDDLFKNRASTKVINRIAGELDRVRKALHEAALQIDRYDTIVDALSGVDKELKTLREKLSVSRREQQQYEALERLWDDWITYSENRQAIDRLGPPAETFPEDGLESLDSLTDKRAQCESTLRELKARHEQLTVRLSRLPVEEKVLGRASDILFLVENRNAYLENMANLPMKSRDADEYAERARRLLIRLGDEWTENVVLDFDRSLFTRESTRAHQTVFDALEKKQLALETLLGEKKAALDRAVDAAKLAERELDRAGRLPPLRDPEAIQRLRQGRDRFFDTLAELQLQTDKLADTRHETDSLQRLAGKKGPGKKWPALVLAAFGAATAASLFCFNMLNEAATTSAVTLVAIWAALVHRRHRQQLYLNHQELIRRQELRTDDISARIRQLESIQEDYARQALAAGAIESDPMGGKTLLNAVDRFFSIISEEDGQRAAVLQARRHQEEKANLVVAARQGVERLGEELADLEKERGGAEKSWAETCRRFGFSDTLSPATALEALDVIEDIIETRQHRERYRNETARLASEVSNYRASAHRLFSDISWPAPDIDDLAQAVGRLSTRLEESRGNQQEKKTLGHQAADLEREMAEIQKELSAVEKAIRHLLETAGMSDEAAFRNTGRIESIRRVLLADARSAEKNMRRISGEMDTATLKQCLESLSLAGIVARKEAADEKAAGIDSELSTLYARRAEFKQALETLASSEDITRLRSREAALISDLSRHARDWARHAVAEHLILQAKEIFEQKHQPEIIQDAGQIFSRMTDEKYQGVVSRLGENTIEAVTRNGDRLSPSKLSRGTAEQLYLAVRFSYIRHQAKKNDPLPVVMDDILVNFDPVRARKAAEAIRSLSASHQVLMFTCHPETVAVFRELDPELSIFTLNDGQIFPPEHPQIPEKAEFA